MQWSSCLWLPIFVLVYHVTILYSSHSLHKIITTKYLPAQNDLVIIMPNALGWWSHSYYTLLRFNSSFLFLFLFYISLQLWFNINKVENLKDCCFSVFNIKENKKILSNKKLKNYWDRFKSLIAKPNMKV